MSGDVKTEANVQPFPELNQCHSDENSPDEKSPPPLPPPPV